MGARVEVELSLLVPRVTAMANRLDALERACREAQRVLIGYGDAADAATRAEEILADVIGREPPNTSARARGGV